MPKYGKYIFSSEWKDLASADPKTRPQAFIKYSQTIIKAQSAGQLDIPSAAYNICGAIRFDELENIPELEEAISIACDLELPSAHRSTQNQDQDKSWKRLQLLIDNYSKGNRKVELRLKIDCAIENSQGQITSSFSGWVYRRHDRLIIKIGQDSLIPDLTDFCQSISSVTDTLEWLGKIKVWLQQPNRLPNGHITASIVEHVKASENHRQFHAFNSFCGSAGRAEMQHLQELINQLSDSQLEKLVKNVGIEFEGQAPTDRSTLEGVIDEADREAFYTEYRKIVSDHNP